MPPFPFAYLQKTLYNKFIIKVGYCLKIVLSIEERKKRINELTCIPTYSDSKIKATTDKSEKTVNALKKE